MPYDPITLLSTLSTIALPPDTQDSLSVSWLDSYRMGFPPMKHYTLCWAHTSRLPLWQYPYEYFIRKCRTLQDGFPAFFFFRLQSRQNRGKLRHHREEGLDWKTGFGYAILSGDAFVGSSFLLMESDDLLFKFGSVVLWHNEYLFSCNFDYISLATPVTTLV